MMKGNLWQQTASTHRCGEAVIGHRADSCPPRQVKSPCNSWSLAVCCLVSSRQPRMKHSPTLHPALLRLSAIISQYLRRQIVPLCAPLANAKVWLLALANLQCFRANFPLWRQKYLAYENNCSIHCWFTDCHCMGTEG